MGGLHQVAVRPWTMAQRRELKPFLADLITKVLTLDDLKNRPKGAELAEIFMVAEDELMQVVQSTVANDLPKEVSWDDLYWEDLPILAQAIWDTSISRGANGGLAGKLAGALAKVGLLRANQTLPPLKQPNSADSASSQEDGEPMPKPSDTL